MYRHSGHCLEVFFDSTTFNGTPSRLALYVKKSLSSPNVHFECLSLCPRPTVTLERIYFKSSIAIALVVPLAFEIIWLDITWLASFLKRRSLPESLFSFLLADLVPTCCRSDLNLEYLCLVSSTFLLSNISLSESTAIFSIPRSIPRASIASYSDLSGTSTTTIR